MVMYVHVHACTCLCNVQWLVQTFGHIKHIVLFLVSYYHLHCIYMYAYMYMYMYINYFVLLLLLLLGKYAKLGSLDLICDHPLHFEKWVLGVSYVIISIMWQSHVLLHPLSHLHVLSPWTNSPLHVNCECIIMSLYSTVLWITVTVEWVQVRGIYHVLNHCQILWFMKYCIGCIFHGKKIIDFANELNSRQL